MEEERPVPEDDQDQRNDDIQRLRPDRDRSEGEIDRGKADRGVPKGLIEDVQGLAIDLSAAIIS